MFNKSWKQIKEKTEYLGFFTTDYGYTNPWTRLLFTDKPIKNPIKTSHAFIILAWHLIVMFGTMTLIAYNIRF